MKKEYTYILVLVIIFVFTLIFKSLFVNDKFAEIQVSYDQLIELKAKSNRDSIIQDNVSNITRILEKNQRGKQNSDLVIAELLKEISVILETSGIKFKSNEIKQEEEEQENGLSFFVFNLNIVTDHTHLFELIKNIEKHDLLIDIVELDMKRNNRNGDNNGRYDLHSSSSNSQFDPYGVIKKIKVEMKLQVVKFI